MQATGPGTLNERLDERFRAAVAALEAVSANPRDYRAIDDAELLRINLLTASVERLADARRAVVAGEIARRSAPALGSQGLAQRAGHRTPEQFLKQTTGISGREAVTAVKAGRLLVEAAAEETGEDTSDPRTGEIVTPTEPWLRPVAAALTAGTISLAAVESIRAGLGRPTSAVTARQLETAAVELCGQARILNVDQLFRHARALRDEFDLDGVQLREEEHRGQRSLRFSTLPDGMSRLVWVMDPETAATVKDLYDRATSPKLGGVRFVGTAQKTRATGILEDDRTAEQLASDAFEQLLRQGADADTSLLLGTGAPAIRVTVTRTALRNRAGLGRIEGQADPVSISTIERLACAGHEQEVSFDERGRPLDVGRTRRLFTTKQRIAMAIRDGGCLAPGCDRPPSWCETHHITFFARDNGLTNVDDGVLLCRHHHLLFHNNGWEIERDEADRYWLIPPTREDPEQTRRPLPSKSAALRDLLPSLR
jgi:hypothetical protein